MDGTTPDPQSLDGSTSWVHVSSNPTTHATPPDATQTDSQSPPTKRRKEDKERSRVSRACDRCKRKKTRCTGRCPCALCLRAGLSCEFTASYTRGKLPSIPVDEEALTASANGDRPKPEIAPSDFSSTSISRSLDYDSTKDTPSRVLQSSNYARPLTYPDQSTAETFSNTVSDKLAVPDVSPSQDPPSRSSPEPTQTDRQGHYIGPASGVSFLLRIQKTLHKNSTLSYDSSIFTFGDAQLPEFDSTFFVMPPKPDAQRLIERYFNFAAPTHRFLHRPTIDEMLNEFYETQGDMRKKEDAAGKIALLLIIFAQAQAYMPSGSSAIEQSARYYFAAEHQLAKERGCVRLTSVQARLGMCFYLLIQSRVNHCWSLFGTTAHLALAIGLNRGRRAECPVAVDHVEHENRKRTFWSAYILDKYLAAALGRPRTFKDEDIDQDLPTVVDDVDLSPSSMRPHATRSQISVMMAPVEHIKLSRIVSCVLRDLYPIRPPSMPLRIELASKYSNDLRQWRAAIARFLDADGVDSSLLIPLYQRQRNVLNLGYYHSVLLVHRPFLLSNFANLAHIDARPGPLSNIDTSHFIAECLDAAMGIVRIVDDLAQGCQIFRAFWFTQYYGFCAVVVLYIYHIQQQFIDPSKCEGYFSAGQRCHAQLSRLSDADCLCKRYCLVLDELQQEATRQMSRANNTGTGPVMSPPNNTVTAEATFSGMPSANGMQVSTSTPQSDTGANFASTFYGTNMPTPDSGIFSANFMPMADLTSWGQFDSLVTGGIGVLDGGYPGDMGFGFGFGR